MMEKTTPDVPLLRKAVEWVEYQAQRPIIDREWNQSSYMLLPNERVIGLLDFEPFVLDGNDQYDKYADLLLPHCGTTYCVAGYISQLLEPRYANNMFVDGVPMSSFATQALGLTNNQAARLFYAENSAEQVRAIAEDIAGEPL